MLFNGGRISVWDAEKVQEMDGGDSCTTVNVHNATEHLKMVKMVCFMCILTTIFL